MSQQALDAIIKKALRDGQFRARLMNPANFEDITFGHELTPEEQTILKQLSEKEQESSMPFARGLDERLSK